VISQSSQKLIIHWDTFNCLKNPQVVDYNKCNIIGPEKSLLSVEIKYNRDFDTFNGTFILRLPRPPTNKFHKIMDLNFNICQFFMSSKLNKFLNIVYRSMSKDSNMPIKCPQLKVGFYLVFVNTPIGIHICIFQGVYYFRNMDIGANVPIFLPKSAFKAELNFYQPKLQILNVSLSGVLTE
ncbi:hypothetical protein KR093_003366, partial [Drosophila rubida]